MILPLALLAACSTSAPDGGGAPASPPATQSGLDTAQLTANHWTLTAATDAAGQRISALFAQADKPMVVNFIDGRLSARAACNTLVAGYTVRGNQLQLTPMASTMMGCPQPLQEQDRQFGNLVEKPATLQALDARQMVLRAANGSVLTFKADPTAQTRYGGPGETVFLEIDSQTKPCNHPLIANMQCLQVRTITYNEAGIKQGTPGPYTHFYGNIEGYTHQPGVRNVVRTKRFQINNPPADGPSQAYVHDMTVESEIVKP
jgi:heat shock protein HslJ